MPLFKYLPAKRALKLGALCVRYTPPTEFADPFDCVPKVQSLNGANVMKARYAAQIERDYQSFLATPTQITSTFPEFERTRQQQMPFETYQEWVLTRQVQTMKLWDEGLRNLLNDFGVLCLCKNGESAAMWSHYAEQHRGVLLEFDEIHPFFAEQKSGKTGSWLEVEYGDTRPAWDYEEEKEVHGDFFKFKSTEWAYEKEVRLIRSLKSHADAYLDENGLPTLYSLPAAAIIGVTVGTRTEPEHVAAIRKELENPSLRHIRPSYAVLDRDGYAIKRVSGWSGE